MKDKRIKWTRLRKVDTTTGITEGSTRGSKLRGRKYSLEHRLAISEGNKRVVVEGRHHWKVNDSRHLHQDRCSIHYKLWKEEVKNLRGNKCKDCGSTERLHCHHIQPYNEFPEKRFEPENGELLCIGCHMRHHRLTKKAVT